MRELKACPFCGGTKICTEKSINLNYCDNCSAESNVEQWNSRPIEDALNKRIAELEAAQRQNWIPVGERLPELQKDNDALKKRVETLQIYADDYWERLKAHRKITRSLNARIDELEAENIRLGIEYQRMRLALGDIAINSKRALNESPTDHLTADSTDERKDDKLPEREVCEACGGDGSILLRDGYKEWATATVKCIYCNGTGRVNKECEE